MKVICIDASTDFDSEIPVDLIEGEVYTVIDVDKEDNEIWYTLLEKSIYQQYSEDAFIPLSEIDETEFERNYNYQYHEQI